MCPKEPKVGQFRSLFPPFLATLVSQIDHKAMELVESESSWCLTIASIKKIILIE